MKIVLTVAAALFSSKVGAEVLHVKLSPEAANDLARTKNVKSIDPLFTLPREKLVELSSSKPGLPDLTLWHKVETVPATEATESMDDITEHLRHMNGVLEVEVEKPVPPPKDHHLRNAKKATTPDFVAQQGYLGTQDSNNNGIDAEFSWEKGGTGEGVTIYDIEYNWNFDHEDWSKEVKLIIGEGDAAVDVWNSFSHGTAVLGEMVGGVNGFGVKGISYDANVAVAPEYTENLGSNRANAILLSVADANEGDVILLEMQTWVCGSGNYGPAEWSQSVFEATQVATANGITVVAAAGNGDVNLDSSGCNGLFDRDQRDSGAIIVGAGGSGMSCGYWGGNAREKLSFSSYGSRVDVQGWGRCVTTTGYGYLHKDTDDSSDKNKWYTSSFSGTSSASPIVAAAVANIQSIAMNDFGGPLDPLEVRDLLKQTGTLQTGDTSKNIGPLVNLRKAIEKKFYCDGGNRVTIDLTTDNYGDETSWELLDGSGNVQASGSGYVSNKDYEISYCVPADTCTFTIYDTVGDGICCGEGTGSYSVIRRGFTYEGNGNFGSSESITICEEGEESAAPTLTASPTQAPSTTPEPTIYVCEDDSPFQDSKGKTRTCDWVGAKKKCNLFSDNCPVTCGTCPTPVPSQAPTLTASPTQAPSTTPEPTIYVCEDASVFQFKGKTRTCDWVGANKKRCNLFSDNCPATCGTCPTPVPSQAPTLTASPTQAPSTTPEPTIYVCEDDSPFQDSKGKTRTCDWVGKKGKCNLYSDNCPVTCNTCPIL